MPDGIHSGLQRAGSRGVFFFFQSKNADRKLNFWKHYDVKTANIIDNRHVIANLIACAPDTPRTMDHEIFKSIFELQEKVIEEILRGHEEKVALQVAPQAIDPIQQILATLVENHLNNPEVDRKRAITAIAFLNTPMLPVQIRELRKLYKNPQQNGSIGNLLGIEAMKAAVSATGDSVWVDSYREPPKLRREDLRLICFDVISN